MAHPLSSTELERSFSKLPSFEKEEISSFLNRGIYFLGLNAPKLAALANSNNNVLVFDDEEKFYKVNPGDHIAYRYEILKILGTGAFGLVIMAYDHKDRRKVAIKIMKRGVVDDMISLLELTTYEFLRERFDKRSDELCHMLDNFKFRGHSCIVFTLCHLDLFETIRANGFKPIKLWKLKIIVRSILKGLRQLHSVNLFHGDLKLDNIAMTDDTSLHATIIDLGTSRYGYFDREGHKLQARFKSPEYLLRLPFGPPTDIWSLACVIFQLATGKYLFQKGADNEDQLAMIIEVLGVPPTRMIRLSEVKNKYFNPITLEPRYCSARMRRSEVSVNKGISPTAITRGLPGTKNPFTKLEKVSPKLVDFLKKCLALDPKKRLTATSALYHAWVRESAVPFSPSISEARCVKIGASASEPAELNKCHKSRKINQYNGRLVKSKSLINCSSPGKCDNDTSWLKTRAKFLCKTYELKSFAKR